MSAKQLHDPGYWDAAAAGYAAQAHPFTAKFAEAVLTKVGVDPSTRVLDIATGTGALALAAARAGAKVLAIDFSPGMVRQVLAHALPGLEARQMDGQALELPDGAFDAVFSIFGVVLFSDWRAGLREMARVTRPGGSIGVAVWKDPQGAATNLLFSEAYKVLYPDAVLPALSPGLSELADPDRLRAAIVAAGFKDVAIGEVTHSFGLEISALADPDGVFGVIPLWRDLTTDQRETLLNEIRNRADSAKVGAILNIPSTALIVTALRPPL